MKKVWLTAGAVLLVACGARTGLLAEGPGVEPNDGSAGVGGAPSLGGSAGTGGGGMGGVAQEGTAGAAGSPIIKTDCTDPSITYIYVVTSEDDLYAFHPADQSFKLVKQHLACPVEKGPTDPMLHHPFSMAVDRKGIARVLYADGNLYRVSTADGSCSPTAFKVQTGSTFFNFGMGYATDRGGPDETLYVAGSGMTSQGVPIDTALGRVDTTSYNLTEVAGFDQDADMELTGTGDGKLYGFFSTTNGPADNTEIVQIDKQTAKFMSAVELKGLHTGESWAFAFWGGDFYFFTAINERNDGVDEGSLIHRYRPSDNTLEQITTFGSEIVGAGVSTCAPEE